MIARGWQMKSEKEKKVIESNIKNYLRESLFKKGNYSYVTEFYLRTAEKTLQTADALMKISEKTDIKKQLGLLENFETYLWVIVSSYYSMFYAVNALFSKNGIKIGDKIAHKVASDVFYYYFVKNNKIARELFEAYGEAKSDAMDLTNYSEQAERLSDNFNSEKEKRHKFQYDTTENIKRGYAQTSLKKARDFLDKIEILVI